MVVVLVVGACFGCWWMLFWLMVVGCWLLAFVSFFFVSGSFWLVVVFTVVGCWLVLVVGCWFLFVLACCWLSVVCCR